jgi:hypothetical protein
MFGHRSTQSVLGKKRLLKVNGTALYLGRFATAEEALAVYTLAAKTHFGAFASV